MKTGLILVDIQNDYFPDGRMALSGMRAACEKAALLLALFRENRWPTFHVQHVSASETASFFLPGTPGAELYDSIRPLPGETVIVKHYPNSFRETTLLEALRESSVERVVICGAMSHMCIDATVRAAADYGFECLLVQDACATRDLEFAGKGIPAREVHGAFMAALGAAYARVLTLDECHDVLVVEGSGSA